MNRQNTAQVINYYKFYIVKRLLHRSFKKNGREYIKGLVLDVGAGLSPFQKYIQNGKIITLDSTNRVNPSVVGAATFLPFKSNSFDSIMCTDVLEHIEEPGLCIREIQRVLKIGGYLYITVPMLWCLHYEPRDFYRFTKYGITYLLEKEGLTIVKVEPIGKIFSYGAARFCEKLYNIVNKIIFFLPKQLRFMFVIPLLLPILLPLYGITVSLDTFNKRDVYSWCVIAKKTTV
jgi:ubiquinone/menaquinone biosynthesis C-methylase UbiE